MAEFSKTKLRQLIRSVETMTVELKAAVPLNSVSTRFTYEYARNCRDVYVANNSFQVSYSRKNCFLTLC